MLPLGWQPKDGETEFGEVVGRLRVARVEDGVVHGAMEYEAAGGRTWTHTFAMHVFADAGELRAALAEGGFALDRWLDRERGWFVATAARARP